MAGRLRLFGSRVESALSRPFRWLRDLLLAALRSVFPLVCLVLVPLLLGGIVVELLRPTPDAKRVAALLVGLFAAAFLAAYGRDVALRVRKLGPVELSDLQDQVLKPSDLPREVTIPGGMAVETIGSPRPPSFSTEEEFHFEQADRYLSFLEFTGRAEPPPGSRRKELIELLWYVGRFANARGQWGKAIQRLEWLERLARPHPNPEAVGDLALATLYAGLQAKVGSSERAKLFAATARRFSRLARAGELDYLGYFWLAYAQDELGQAYEAVGSNREAIKRHPRLAPARYNMAISLLKLDDPEEAYKTLAAILPDDEHGRETLASAPKDAELAQQLKRFAETRWGRRIAEWLDRQRREG